MTASLQVRLDFLRKHQNPDGGWGYFPGRQQSWLEPTGWAALALQETDSQASERAWKLIRSWQNEDGTCRPCAAVASPNWTAALTLIHAVLRKDDSAVRRGVAYLVDITGEDSSLLSRVKKFIAPDYTDREPQFKGWPWRPGNSSWIEPTAHSITALRLAARVVGKDKVAARIESAQNMILHQRCKDGGWNYGATFALGHNLTSFPETTGLALVGLVGRPQDAASGLEYAAGLLAQSKLSPLAKVWLGATFQMHGRPEAAVENADSHGDDILLAALQSVNWRSLAV